MKHLLLAKGLWGLVDGIEDLRSGATAQQQGDFKRRQQKTFSEIVLSISNLVSSLTYSQATVGLLTRLKFCVHSKECGAGVGMQLEVV